jgi:hypothetical protein
MENDGAMDGEMNDAMDPMEMEGMEADMNGGEMAMDDMEGMEGEMGMEDSPEPVMEGMDPVEVEEVQAEMPEEMED